LLEALAKGEAERDIEVEAELKGRPGERVVLLMNFSLARDESGEIQGAWFVVQDVTASRRAERQLQEERSRLQTIMDTVPVGILIGDKNGVLRYGNAEAERIWGHSLVTTGPEGYYRYNLYNENGSPMEPEDSLLTRILVGGEARAAARRLVRRANGTSVHLLSVAAPIVDQSGNTEGAVVVFNDVTSSRLLELQHQRLLAISQAVNSGAELMDILRMVRDAIVETTPFDRAGIWLYDEEAGGMRGAWGTTREGNSVDESDQFFSLGRTGDHPLVCIIRGERRYIRNVNYSYAKRPSPAVDMSGVGAHAAAGLMANDRVSGILFVDNFITNREISNSDMESLIPYCEQAAIAIENSRLRKSESERADRLASAVRETNHRVKNNLQQIVALLDSRLMDGSTTVSIEEIRHMIDLIRAIASVHDFLTHREDALEINVRQVFGRLLPMFQASTLIGCRMDADDECLSIKQATALALILNELISNSAKHGGTNVEIVFRSSDGHCRLELTDDGPGFPNGFDPKRDAHFGLELITTLAGWDLKGTIEFKNCETGGCWVKVEFPREYFQSD
jgi:two-component sensor histidine kinase